MICLAQDEVSIHLSDERLIFVDSKLSEKRFSDLQYIFFLKMTAPRNPYCNILHLDKKNPLPLRNFIYLISHFYLRSNEASNSPPGSIP